jgi:hypothetical protein
MDKKKIFWIVFAGLIVILLILLSFRPKQSGEFLTIENSEGGISELTFNDIYTIRGINFKKLRVYDDVPFEDDMEEIITGLENFYEKYREERGKSLIKILDIDQVIRRSNLRSMNYIRLTFRARDGMSVMIEPVEPEDFIIFLAIEKNQGRFNLRLITPLDSFQQRWLRDVYMIYIEIPEDF